LGAEGSETSTTSGLRAGLRELGYREGHDIIIEYSYADGSEEKLKKLAAAAIAERPDLILAPGTIVTRAIKELTSTIPVVSTTGDPVGSGFAASLARPGGNITGLSIAVGPEIAGKYVELLAEIAPGASPIAVLANAQNTVTPASVEHMRIAAKHFGLTVTVFPYQGTADFPAALAAIERAQAHALIPDTDPLTTSKRESIVAFAAEHRLPAVYGLRDFVDAGGLVSYGASIFDVWRRAATYVDRILKGTKPADLPIEQPTKFDLVINLKTAAVQGLTIPPSILARADEVIE
jgi:putative ABC transport system substrate-binding protein